jgi:hypothetical protein
MSLIGRIYKLTCSKDDTFYIGCTTLSLSDRFESHKTYIRRKKSSKLYTHYATIGWENVSITLILEVPIHSIQHLLIYESQYILKNIANTNCLNTNIPFSSTHLSLSKKDLVLFPPDFVYELHTLYCNLLASKAPQCNKKSIYIHPQFHFVNLLANSIRSTIRAKNSCINQLNSIFISAKFIANV